jgi:hypothetical protein
MSSLRIYANHPGTASTRTTSSLTDPDDDDAPLVVARIPARAAIMWPAIGPEIEQAILEILQAARGQEIVSEAFRRKEQELRAVFVAFTPIEAGSLLRRLSNPGPGDVLAEQFGRLVVERKQRLLAVLASAPRRAAIARVRK